MKIFKICTALFLVALTFSSVPVTHAQTAYITDSDISNQKEVVKSEVYKALYEHVKLLQMLYIQRLEIRLAELQAHA